MANLEHLDLVKQGTEIWNRWYKEHYWGNTPDLRDADLSNLDLSDIRLSFARLEGANFSGSNLQRAYFVKSRLAAANLSHANLREAHLDRTWLNDANLQNAQLTAAKIRNANLTRANLNEANLNHANLIDTYFSATSLRSTDLSFARFGNNAFIQIDFSTAYGLETVVHTMVARLVEIRTLLQTRRGVPEQFLQDAGFSEHMAHLPPELESISTEFPTCLLTYGRDDRIFAEQLLNDLQAKGVFCRAEPIEDLTGKLIASYDKLLLIISDILSDDGLRHKLRWMVQEVRGKAYWEARDWESSTILRTITLDKNPAVNLGALLGAWSGLLQRTKLPSNDFSGWRNSGTYQKALSRLLDELRISNASANDNGIV